MTQLEFIGPPTRYASWRKVKENAPKKKSFAECYANAPQLSSIARPPVESRCSICHGTGFLRRDVPVGDPLFGKPQKCQCKLTEQTKGLFSDANIPETHRDCTFETYLGLPLNEQQKLMAIQVQTFVQTRTTGYQSQKRGLFLYGSWGLGKTGLAIAAMRMVLDAGQSALYLPTYKLFQMLRESIAASQRLKQGYGNYDDREEESAGTKLLRLTQSVSWLVLDDIGVECSSSWVIEHLYALLEGRRSQGLFTIFTSNKDARSLEQKWHPENRPEAFDDAMRIIQRMGEYCTMLYLSGKNLREL